ncbi:MAG TPA: hypothetical protein ENK67_07420 [Flavobacteriia bacterium]|nr:hypothetical protein [Flavobacteriia bacterium]
MKLILSTIITIFLFSCNTVKFVKTPPFYIEDAKYQYWFGGREGVRGISVKILLKDIDKKVQFENLYFRNKKLKVSLSKKNNLKLLSANINTSTTNQGLKMHVDAKKEYGNTLLKTDKEFPFTLKENEAVIEYKKENKEYFYKVKLQKEKDLYMP